MNLRLTDKTAIVTASSDGLGKACAEALVQEGANVVICARGQDRLNAVADELSGTAQRCNQVLPVVCDLMNHDDIDDLVDLAEHSYGTVHILVNNIGSPPRGGVFERTPDEYRAGFEALFMSVLRLSQSVALMMKTQKWGRITTIASSTARRPTEHLAISSCIRPAVIALTKLLAKELAPFNILVNSVCPGLFDTAPVVLLMQEQARRDGIGEKEVVRKLEERIPLGRLGNPRELGDLVAFLSSDRVGFLTGTSILIDGGRNEALW